MTNRSHRSGARSFPVTLMVIIGAVMAGAACYSSEEGDGLSLEESTTGGPGSGSSGSASSGSEDSGGRAITESGGERTSDSPTLGVTGGPIGFATFNGGTTGGLGGQTVTVTTFSQLKTYAESSTPYVILVSGTISNGPDGGQVRVKSNKSLVGIGDNAFLNGVGLDISSSNNIIVQNLRISMTGVTTRTNKPGVYTSSGDGGLPQILVNGGDAISISGTSKNVWIDHCELFSEDPSEQTNIDLYDGLIDIKGQTGFITISWCYLHDHHKGALVGASDNDLYQDRKVTYHHNYFRDVKKRAPSYRGAVGHFFNNYVVGATDATFATVGTCLRVEKNYYEPLHYSIYTASGSIAGSTQRIDNIEVAREPRPYPSNCTANIPYTYDAALTVDTDDVKIVVPESAGVGNL